MWIQRRYRLEKPVLYNNIGTKELYGAFVNPGSVALVCGERRILEGSLLAVGEELMKRAYSIGRYKGDGVLYLNNPYPFAPGDVLRLIGSRSPSPVAEYNAVTQGTAPVLGTVTAVIGDSSKQVLEITPTSIVKGNIITLWIEWIPVTYVAQSDSPASVVAGLKKAITSIHGENSILGEVEVSATETALSISHRDVGQIFQVFSSVEQGGGLTKGELEIKVSQGVGGIQITPQAGAPTPVPTGSKIGTIDQAPLGVIAHDYYFNDSDGEGRVRDLAAYNEAMLNRKALTYLDGAIIQQLPNLSYMPHYLDAA
jgi:hypothetical protein